MTDTLTVRFCEREFYSIEHDCEVIEFQAVTSVGTWHAWVEAHTRKVSEQRRAFQQVVLGKMSLGQYPDYIDMDEEITIG